MDEEGRKGRRGTMTGVLCLFCIVLLLSTAYVYAFVYR